MSSCLKCPHEDKDLFWQGQGRYPGGGGTCLIFSVHGCANGVSETVPFLLQFFLKKRHPFSKMSTWEQGPILPRTRTCAYEYPGGGTCLIFSVCGCANGVSETVPFLLQIFWKKDTLFLANSLVKNMLSAQKHTPSLAFSSKKHTHSLASFLSKSPPWCWHTHGTAYTMSAPHPRDEYIEMKRP